ncbi:uncharacterized protein LOC134274400 [Saccostrea cucullata]|uniref:uncharacterized protein LOC134274400 n=1 Tax=Saccostrea cuccullata TaxID=36930 RepID=UPI002ED28C61
MNILGKVVFLCLVSVNVCFLTEASSGQRKQYAMYVWRNGFDPNIPGCGKSEFLTWDSKHSHCFTHTWNTAGKRQWLWATCNLQGREVSSIFLADVYHKLKTGYQANSCHSSNINLLRTTLLEGHSHVSNLKIYALFAASDADVSERHMIPYVVWYNDHCTHTNLEKFDGVAVNNEAYASIKCSHDIDQRRTFLDHLQEIHDEAQKQQDGNLLTHFSVSWHWGRCGGHSQPFLWRGKTMDASHHMIDIFDSIDVQVGYTIFPQIRDRMEMAGRNYSSTLRKNIFVTFYTDKTEPCQITFFPQNCHLNGRSESNLFSIIDQFPQNGLGQEQPCIHYFRGVYSSGGNEDWPVHL